MVNVEYPYPAPVVISRGKGSLAYIGYRRATGLWYAWWNGVHFSGYKTKDDALRALIMETSDPAVILRAQAMMGAE